MNWRKVFICAAALALLACLFTGAVALAESAPSPLFASSLKKSVERMDVFEEPIEEPVEEPVAETVAEIMSKMPTIGTFTCGATCGSTCSSTCNYTCGYTCGSTCGSTCNTTCTGTCAGTSTCGSTCTHTCKITCQSTCAGNSTCSTTCAGQSTCTHTCSGSPTCTYTCAGQSTCGSTCSGTACTNVTVTFDSQGGSEVASVSVKKGALVPKPDDPTRAGFAFNGWYEESSCKNKWDFASHTVSGDTTLYAKWTASETDEPGVPDGLEVVSKSYNSLTISWNASANADGYQVYRATAKKGEYTRVKTLSTTSFVNSGLTTNAAYYYKVRAYAEAGGKTVYSEFSEVKSGKPKLAVPASLKAKRASNTSIKLTWKKVGGAEGYQVYRAASSGGTYKKVATVKALNVTNKGLKKGKTYYYKVRAYRTVNGKTVCGAFSEVASAKT